MEAEKNVKDAENKPLLACEDTGKKNVQIQIRLGDTDEKWEGLKVPLCLERHSSTNILKKQPIKHHTLRAESHRMVISWLGM